MTPDMEPTVVTDPAVLDVLHEQIRRGPIFHRPELGTARADFENSTLPDYWEVGASGRRYSRDYVLDTLEKRYVRSSMSGKLRAFICRKLAADVYLLSYTLIQANERKTRRSTIWQRTAQG